MTQVSLVQEGAKTPNYKDTLILSGVLLLLAWGVSELLSGPDTGPSPAEINAGTDKIATESGTPRVY